MSLPRREFIKQACGFCAALAGVGAFLPLVASCSPLQTLNANFSDNQIAVSINDFAANSSLLIITHEDLDFDIALVKSADQQYRAFKLECTHRSNPLVATKSGFFCSAHGSQFSLDGVVTQAPASQNLKEFQVQVSKEKITINR